MPPAALMTPDDDLIALYRGAHPRSRFAEPRWRLWGAQITAEWRRDGRPGAPWAAKFDEGYTNGGGCR